MNENDELMQKWQEAYVKANKKKAPNITYKKGWFIIMHKGDEDFENLWRKVRKNDLESMINVLISRSN